MAPDSIIQRAVPRVGWIPMLLVIRNGLPSGIKRDVGPGTIDQHKEAVSPAAIRVWLRGI